MRKFKQTRGSLRAQVSVRILDSDGKVVRDGGAA
jgi:hypothetical protein